MAGWTGLEPATSGVTGRRSNQLNYHPLKGKCEVQGTEFKVKGEVLLCTMNSELKCYGRRNRDRTCDPSLVRAVLSQLSYPPDFRRNGVINIYYSP